SMWPRCSRTAAPTSGRSARWSAPRRSGFRFKTCLELTLGMLRKPTCCGGWAFSCAGVELTMNGLEPVAVHVRVVLRGADVGVPQEFLHGAQVGPAGQEVGGEA